MNKADCHARRFESLQPCPTGPAGASQAPASLTMAGRRS